MNHIVRNLFWGHSDQINTTRYFKQINEKITYIFLDITSSYIQISL